MSEIQKKENRKNHCIRINKKTSDWLRKHGGIGPTIEKMVARCIEIEAKRQILGEEIDESEFFLTKRVGDSRKTDSIGNF